MLATIILAAQLSQASDLHIIQDPILKCYNLPASPCVVCIDPNDAAGGCGSGYYKDDLHWWAYYSAKVQGWFPVCRSMLLGGVIPEEDVSKCLTILK